ncbi:cytochrome P450 family protein [Ceratobasidium sp. AG-Ba]|nr:cytochrome P450 family protein [Ceratobasidium sp. AG-Ba]
MAYENLTLVVAGVFATISALYGLKQRKSSQRHLPPSPGGSLPLVGHAFVLPVGEEHLTYAKWSKDLNSDIISLQALGQTIIVLSSVRSATELLEGRSAIYSDRPQLRVISDHDLLDWSYNTGSLPYGSRWRKQRRITHEILKSSGDDQHFARMEGETRAMVKRMLQGSSDPEKEIRRNVAAQIMATVYGYTVKSSDDYFVRGVQTAVEHFSIAALPANFLVNFIPWLKYIPEWVPGTGWKRVIKEWRIQRDAMVQEPFDWTKSQISSGVAEPSMVETHLLNIANNPTLDLADEEDHLKWAASTLFAGASDTTVSSTLSFIIAMILYPEVQAKAQGEVDSVVGDGRLPDMSDRDRMPYVRNVVREALRWQPVLPLGFPHASTEDDVYRGYFIPKGSIVMSNTWAMTRDQSVYIDPEAFNPDRFLDASVPDAPAFGFGRRICPGASFAEASLFITFASMLAAFNIKPGRDPITGEDIIPKAKVTTHALVSHPLPFACILEPRSDLRAKLFEDVQ